MTMRALCLFAFIITLSFVTPSNAAPRCAPDSYCDAPVTVASAAAFGAGGNAVVRYMRRYVGSNPTGWRSRWCGKMLDMALRATGHPPGSNLAKAYAKYGRPAAGPAPGVIGIVPRKGGGHVFVVTAVLSDRAVLAISGNDGGRVRERERSTRGVIAWRWPT